jgi:large subunit ribosomal protein L17
MLLIGLLEESTGGSPIGWLMWAVLVIFALLVITGWLTSRKTALETESTTQIHPHGMEDDLTVLEGIGPKVAKVLHAAGISSFAALAEAEPGKVQEYLKQAGLRMFDPQGWIEQARFAARGDADGLAKLQAELKGGRHV